MSRKRGFTLIEMMIVILVIAVLAAIVGLALRNMGRDSRQAKAQADIENLNTGATWYENQTGDACTGAAVLLADTGADGWHGPYILEDPEAPQGWVYACDAGRWTATGPDGQVFGPPAP